MNIETDGSFQYLSNRIVYRSDNELPSPQAGIEVLRFDAEDGVRFRMTRFVLRCEAIIHKDEAFLVNGTIPPFHLEQSGR